MQQQIDKESADIEAALKRAAITAKALADKNGTPYVVLNENNKNKPVVKATPQKLNK